MNIALCRAIIRKKLPIFIRRLLHNQKENENGGRNTIREELVGCTILMVRGSRFVLFVSDLWSFLLLPGSVYSLLL